MRLRLSRVRNERLIVNFTCKRPNQNSRKNAKKRLMLMRSILMSKPKMQVKSTVKN